MPETLPVNLPDRVAACSPMTWAGPDVTDFNNEADIMLLLENGQCWHVGFQPGRGWFQERIA